MFAWGSFFPVNMYEDLKKHFLCVCVSPPKVFLLQPAGFDLPLAAQPGSCVSHKCTTLSHLGKATNL